jgi:hypothetical protein
MYHIEIGTLKYRYLVGTYTVGIITPSRKRHLLRIDQVTGRPAGSRTGVNNGTADSRLTPEEVAEYVLKNKLK